MPNRPAQALQGFAIDGRVVKSLRVSFWVRGQDLRPVGEEGLPVFRVHFYDENRAPVGEETVGPWRGSFGWQRKAATLRVPLKAREAVVRIGLLGATGELSFDAIQLGRAED
jgi:protein-L-isoaspartate(D-aspartate) O-methyltransferase